MKHGPNINLIATRIKQLGTSVVKWNAEDAFDLKDITVHAIDVEEGGFVWLSIMTPDKCPNEFFMELSFHKDKLPYQLNLSGIAAPVKDPAEISALPEVLKKVLKPGRVLISLKISHVDYVELQVHRPEYRDWVKQLKDKLWAKFQPSLYTPFNFKETHPFRDRLS